MTWLNLIPEERGKIRESIWRVLRSEGSGTQNGLMRRLAMDYAIVGEALGALLESGAVSLATENGTKIYSAILLEETL
jgi:hypothetical protein